MTPVVLLSILSVFGVVFIAIWVLAARRQKTSFPNPRELGIGFVTNFFDALGIGSFATTTSLFKLLRVVPDENIPGTLNVGLTIPGVVEAFIFISIVSVDPLTLVLLIAAAIVGAWLGSGVVARWPKRNIQIGMGTALLAAATLFTLSNLKLSPAVAARWGSTAFAYGSPWGRTSALARS